MSAPSEYANAAESLEIALEPACDRWYAKHILQDNPHLDSPEQRKEEAKFTRDFWVPKWNARFSPLVARIDGKHYLIGDEDSKAMRGFGGVKYTIRFFDGREVTTTNLWSQGEIPEEIRELYLPDNAEFVEDEEEVKIPTKEELGWHPEDEVEEPTCIKCGGEVRNMGEDAIAVCTECHMINE
jgi:hypothetical protein